MPSIFGFTPDQAVMAFMLASVLAYMSLRAMGYLLKAAGVGMLFAAIPTLGSFMGMSSGVGLRTVALYVLAGMAFYFAVSTTRFWWAKIRKHLPRNDVEYGGKRY